MVVGVFSGLVYLQLEIHAHNSLNITKDNGGVDYLMDSAHIKKLMVTCILEALKMDWNMEKEHNFMETEISIRDSLLTGLLKDMDNIHGVTEAFLKVIFSKGSVVDMEFGKQEKTVLNLIKVIFILIWKQDMEFILGRMVGVTEEISKMIQDMDMVSFIKVIIF